MSAIKSLLTTIAALISLSVVGTAKAQSLETRYCPGPVGDPGERMLHETILENAILAELAYGEEDKASLNLQQECPNGASSSAEDGISIKIAPLHDFIFDQAKKGFGNGRDIEISKTKDGHIRCSGQDREDRIAAAYEFTEINGRLSLLIKIAIVGVTGVLETEELAVLRLTDEGGKEILGIRGTESWRPGQWNASVSGLIGSSCIFPFSVEVAKSFFNYDFLSELNLTNFRRFAVVGHSLGGAVVQHLMVQEDFNGALTTLEKALGQDGFEFRAYSFNSIGVSGEVASGSLMPNLTSVRVAGEILEQIEADLEEGKSRRQIGQIFRYSTDSDRWFSMDPIEFHKIDSVQKAICECLDGSSPTFQFEFRP